MKRLSLIGFRGTSFRDTKYKHEPALIRAGHVALLFESTDEDQIIGFHPTPEAIAAIGGEDAAIEHLKAKNILEGRLQEDLFVFMRAYELSQQDPRTMVWVFEIELSDEEFEQIYQRVFKWYNESTIFAYAFPSDAPMPDRDNCATFPRHLGLPLLDPVGQIKDYVRELENVWETLEAERT